MVHQNVLLETTSTQNTKPKIVGPKHVGHRSCRVPQGAFCLQLNIHNTSNEVLVKSLNTHLQIRRGVVAKSAPPSTAVNSTAGWRTVGLETWCRYCIIWDVSVVHSQCLFITNYQKDNHSKISYFLSVLDHSDHSEQGRSTCSNDNDWEITFYLEILWKRRKYRRTICLCVLQGK